MITDPNFSLTTLFQILFTSVFMGFGIVIPILSLIKTANLKGLHFKELFTLQGIQAVRMAGVLNLFLQIPLIYHVWQLQQPHEGIKISMDGSNMANYGAVIFYAPLLYFILSQLLWIKKLYINKKSLIALALVLLILPSKLVLNFWISLFHTDYTVNFKANDVGSVALQLLLSVVVFFFTTFLLMQLSGKMKKVLK